LSAIGALFGSGYIVHEGLRAVALALGLSNPFLDSDAVARVLILVCLALTLTGSTIPAWGNRIGLPALLAWFDRYRVHRQLYPLWHDLYRVAPEIALFPPRSPATDALALRDLDLRLYRRIVEIRDGILALRRSVDPWVMERARELGRAAHLQDQEIQAVVEAASIAAGLHARLHDKTVHSDTSPLPPWGGDDVMSEAASLARVSWSYRRSPIVRTILTQINERDASGPADIETPASTR
jgi:hypothetical protein